MGATYARGQHEHVHFSAVKYSAVKQYCPQELINLLHPNTGVHVNDDALLWS